MEPFEVITNATTGEQTIRYLTPEEIADLSKLPSRIQQEASRKAAYVAEADPIFFMAQRGEATIAEWEAKIAEIKARFPYPTE